MPTMASPGDRAAMSPAAASLRSIQDEYRRGNLSPAQRAALKAAVLDGATGVVVNGVLSPVPAAAAAKAADMALAHSAGKAATAAAGSNVAVSTPGPAGAEPASAGVAWGGVGDVARNLSEASSGFKGEPERRRHAPAASALGRSSTLSGTGMARAQWGGGRPMAGTGMASPADMSTRPAKPALPGATTRATPEKQAAAAAIAAADAVLSEGKSAPPVSDSDDGARSGTGAEGSASEHEHKNGGGGGGGGMGRYYHSDQSSDTDGASSTDVSTASANGSKVAKAINDEFVDTLRFGGTGVVKKVGAAQVGPRGHAFRGRRGSRRSAVTGDVVGDGGRGDRDGAEGKHSHSSVVEVRVGVSGGNPGDDSENVGPKGSSGAAGLFQGLGLRAGRHGRNASAKYAATDDGGMHGGRHKHHHKRHHRPHKHHRRPPASDDDGSGSDGEGEGRLEGTGAKRTLGSLPPIDLSKAREWEKRKLAPIAASKGKHGLIPGGRRHKDSKKVLPRANTAGPRSSVFGGTAKVAFSDLSNFGGSGGGVGEAADESDDPALGGDVRAVRRPVSPVSIGVAMDASAEAPEPAPAPVPVPPRGTRRAGEGKSDADPTHEAGSGSGTSASGAPPRPDARPNTRGGRPGRRIVKRDKSRRKGRRGSTGGSGDVLGEGGVVLPRPPGYGVGGLYGGVNGPPPGALPLTSAGDGSVTPRVADDGVDASGAGGAAAGAQWTSDRSAAGSDSDYAGGGGGGYGAAYEAYTSGTDASYYSYNGDQAGYYSHNDASASASASGWDASSAGASSHAEWADAAARAEHDYASQGGYWSASDADAASHPQYQGDVAGENVSLPPTHAYSDHYYAGYDSSNYASEGGHATGDESEYGYGGNWGYNARDADAVASGSEGQFASDREEAGGGIASSAHWDVFSWARHGRVNKVKEALESGMRVETRDKFGNTLLMVAAQNGNKRIVKLCLRHDADVNATNRMGNTALHFCFAYGYTALAEYMISKGADDSVTNNAGLAPYDGLGW